MIIGEVLGTWLEIVMILVVSSGEGNLYETYNSNSLCSALGSVYLGVCCYIVITIKCLF